MITKHVGRVANTGQRCVVAFLQIPGKEDHALLIPTDNLPPRFEQAVMDVLKTQEGQQEVDFGNALGRHLMPDTHESILESLHKNGKLLPMPVANVMMLPQPNNPVKLSSILEQLGRLPQQVDTALETNKFNPHLYNQQSESAENNRAKASGLLIEAEMLEAEAMKKREQAYLKDPSLKGNGHDRLPYVSLPEPTIDPMAAIFAKPVDPWAAFDQRLTALEDMFGKLVDQLAGSPVDDLTEDAPVIDHT